MKPLKFILLLQWFVGLNGTLNHYGIAKILNIPENVAARIIERIAHIDQLNTHHASYYPILSQLFLTERNYKIGCEIGIFTGGHAKFILDNSAIERLYCVDSYVAPLCNTIITDGFEKNYWQACWDTIYYYAVDKLSSCKDRVQFIRLPAEQAATIIADYSLDFIFIDGDHSYAAVLADCTNYYDKVRSGGIIAGDDYDVEEVGQAVRRFFAEKNLMINVYPGQKRFWWVEKP